MQGGIPHLYLICEVCKVDWEFGYRHLGHILTNSKCSQVPVLKDGDFVLTESVAMLRYLAREKQVGFNLIRVPDHLNAQRVGGLGISQVPQPLL